MNLPTGLKSYPKLKAIVKAAILDSFARNKGNLSAMRFELGVGRVTIYRHLKAYGVKCVKDRPIRKRGANGKFTKT